MDREQIADCRDHAVTQAIDAANSQRLARELGQLIGKYLAEHPLNDKFRGEKRRPGVDAESTVDTIIQTGHIGDAVVGHSNHRHEDRDSDSEDPIRSGPSPVTRNAVQDGR